MQPRSTKSVVRRQKPSTLSTHVLKVRYDNLRKRWNSSRAESRQAAANAQKVRSESREAVRQWNEVVAQTRQLRLVAQQNRQLNTSATAVSIVQTAKLMVATARRVPWQRLQIEDLDGAYQLWVAPGEELR